MFTLYSIALFFHITGVLGIFSATAIEWVFLLILRRSENINNLKPWFAIMPGIGKIHGPSWLLILISGLYMSLTIWGFPYWLIITFALIVLIISLGMGLSGRLIKNVIKEIIQADNLTAELRNKLRNPRLILSASLRTALALEIVLLMIVKPDLTASLITLLCAVVIAYLAQLGFNKKLV